MSSPAAFRWLTNQPNLSGHLADRAIQGLSALEHYEKLAARPDLPALTVQKLVSLGRYEVVSALAANPAIDAETLRRAWRKLPRAAKLDWDKLTSTNVISGRLYDIALTDRSLPIASEAAKSAVSRAICRSLPAIIDVLHRVYDAKRVDSMMRDDVEAIAHANAIAAIDVFVGAPLRMLAKMRLPRATFAAQAALVARLQAVVQDPSSTAHASYTALSLATLILRDQACHNGVRKACSDLVSLYSPRSSYGGLRFEQSQETREMITAFSLCSPDALEPLIISGAPQSMMDAVMLHPYATDDQILDCAPTASLVTVAWVALRRPMLLERLVEMCPHLVGTGVLACAPLDAQRTMLLTASRSMPLVEWGRLMSRLNMTQDDVIAPHLATATLLNDGNHPLTTVLRDRLEHDPRFADVFFAIARDDAPLGETMAAVQAVLETSDIL